jgi:hypothetical protein
MSTEAAAKNTTPENRAYKDANSFAAGVRRGSTGPMPPRIMLAFKRASTQGSPAT